MKQKLFLIAVMTVVLPFFAVADNGILTPIEFNGYDLSPVAYCQEGEDYLVESVMTNSETYNIYNSSWKKVCSIYEDQVEDVALISSATHSYQGEDGFRFSQTLLNDDAEFEYMVEKEGDNYGSKGFKIMQSNGNCLADITFEEEDYIEGPRFILLKDKLYLLMSCSYVNYLYEVNRQSSTNVLNLVSERKVSDGYPNPVKRGEIYTIDCGKRSMKNAVINVVRLDGSLAQSFSTGDNEKVEINTSALNSGVYIYTAIRGSRVIASGRFVIE